MHGRPAAEPRPVPRAHHPGPAVVADRDLERVRRELCRLASIPMAELPGDHRPTIAQLLAEASRQARADEEAADAVLGQQSWNEFHPGPASPVSASVAPTSADGSVPAPGPTSGTAIGPGAVASTVRECAVVARPSLADLDAALDELATIEALAAMLHGRRAEVLAHTARLAEVLESDLPDVTIHTTLPSGHDVPPADSENDDEAQGGRTGTDDAGDGPDGPPPPF
jgi:hypothetical protein